MKQIQRLAMLGGDARQISASAFLSKHGYDVRVWALGNCHDACGNATVCDTWEDAIQGAEAVILPLPISSDGVRVHCPLHDGDDLLRLTTLIDRLAGRLLLGGRIPPFLRALAHERGVECLDYYECELLQQKNALPTAEGAIAIAMQALPITIDGATTAVLGYGRIGSLLAAKLEALGAHVTVYARRQQSLTAASLCHHDTARLTQNEHGAALSALPIGCRAVFNTVPERLIPNDALSIIPRDCLYVDLASAPGGIDHTAAAAMGLSTVWGTALPGKCAPETAGIIVAEAIITLLSPDA